MITIRMKIIAALIAATITVLILATSLMLLVFNPKATLIDVTTEQIATLTPMLDGGSQGFPQPTTPAAQMDAESTVLLRAALQRAGMAGSAAIYSSPDHSNDEILLFTLPSGQLIRLPIMSIAFPSAHRLWLVLWIGAVLIGLVVVAMFVADRIVRPLALLQSTVSAIGKEGALPWITETGPMEIRATATAINSLAAKLRDALESRMRLVAAAGHDFRTPLTRMRLRAEFMSDEKEKEPWLRDISELDHIADSAIWLVQEEISPAGQETIELHALLEDTVTDFRAVGYPITLGENHPFVVSAGPLALRRALRNLLLNAITHGKSASVRLISCGDRGSIFIDDIGPGIPEALMVRVFEPFFRVDAARQQAIPGAGLGLAIAKEIINRHGGVIKLTNNPAGGLTQCITFPRAPYVTST